MLATCIYIYLSIDLSIYTYPLAVYIYIYAYICLYTYIHYGKVVPQQQPSLLQVPGGDVRSPAGGRFGSWVKCALI